MPPHDCGCPVRATAPKHPPMGWWSWPQARRGPSASRSAPGRQSRPRGPGFPRQKPPGWARLTRAPASPGGRSQQQTDPDQRVASWDLAMARPILCGDTKEVLLGAPCERTNGAESKQNKPCQVSYCTIYKINLITTQPRHLIGNRQTCSDPGEHRRAEGTGRTGLSAGRSKLSPDGDEGYTKGHVNLEEACLRAPNDLNDVPVANNPRRTPNPSEQEFPFPTNHFLLSNSN